MDQAKARDWEAKLCGTSIEGWTIEALIDHGKSAAVFRAIGADGLVALKIFDDEIIQRYGDKAQLERIQRELALVGKSHPNMVRIVAGGIHKQTGNHFIIMDFLNGPSLSKCLADIPETNVASIVEQLVSACEFLEQQNLVHRDIKPANIVMLDNFSHLMLLDFGVLRPVGEAGLTDVDGQRLFVGTLQYSSPEFLLREEKDDENGWRALSLYQVGAVLHDLIMRRPLFDEFVNPYAALVNAVQHEQPTIVSKAVPSYLIDACRMALVKNPEKRLTLVTWDSFRPPAATSTADAARQRISRRLLLADAQDASVTDEGPATLELLETVIDGLKIELRRIRQANASIMPPLEVTRGAKFAPEIRVWMESAAGYGLAKGLQLDIAVEVIDVDSQAVLIEISAAVIAKGSGSGPRTMIFRGPYSTAAVGEKIEAAILVALDQAQDGAEGLLSMADAGVD